MTEAYPTQVRVFRDYRLSSPMPLEEIPKSRAAHLVAKLFAGSEIEQVSKDLLDLDCEHSVAWNCQDALEAYQDTVLQKMLADA